MQVFVLFAQDADGRPSFLDWSETAEIRPKSLELKFPIRMGDEKSDLEAAELTYAICNSYPEEMHCPAEFIGDVICYRKERHRSLCCGDVVYVKRTTPRGLSTGKFYIVAMFGFKEIDPEALGIEINDYSRHLLGLHN